MPIVAKFPFWPAQVFAHYIDVVLLNDIASCSIGYAVKWLNFISFGSGFGSRLLVIFKTQWTVIVSAFRDREIIAF